MRAPKDIAQNFQEVCICTVVRPRQVSTAPHSSSTRNSPRPRKASFAADGDPDVAWPSDEDRGIRLTMPEPKAGSSTHSPGDAMPEKSLRSTEESSRPRARAAQRATMFSRITNLVSLEYGNIQRFLSRQLTSDGIERVTIQVEQYPLHVFLLDMQDPKSKCAKFLS